MTEKNDMRKEGACMTLEEMKRMKQERGYTMAQLSEFSGVPLGTLQKIFTGETAHPRYATRQALEKVLTGKDTSCVREMTSSYGVQKKKKQGEYTIEDYYTLPDERRAELIDGVIYDMSAPEVVHQRIAGRIFFRISEYIQKKQGKCIPMMSPVDVRLDSDDKTMVQPDVIILCDENKVKRWGIMGAPEFVLEVTSGSTRKKDYTKKLQKYADAGVKEYWIIDPKKKSLVTYDFINEDMPCIQSLEGKVGLALYNGELEINLEEIADLIQEWPE